MWKLTYCLQFSKFMFSILQKKVRKVTFFILQEFFDHIPSRFISFVYSPIPISFFQFMFVLNSRFFPQNWKTLNIVNQGFYDIFNCWGACCLWSRWRCCYLGGASFVRLICWFILISQSIKLVQPVPWEIRHFYGLMQKRVWKSYSENVRKSIETQFLWFFCFDHVVNVRETGNLIGFSQ